MIDKNKIEDLVAEAINTLEKKDEVFVGAILVKPNNTIHVFIDSDTSVSIDDCVKVSKYVEKHLDRDEEDFELNVSSFGLDQPLIMPRQYRKNIGRSLRFVLHSGEDFTAEVKNADENGVEVISIPKSKKEEAVEKSISYSEINKAKVVISFK